MKMTKELLDKVNKYQTSKEECVELLDEITTEIATKTNIEKEIITDVFVADTPSGELQLVDEYCDQHPTDDGFEGVYYHPVEDSDKYIAFSFESGF